MATNSYNMQLLRGLEIKDDLDTAISALDSYQYHLIGQPIMVRYREDGDIKCIFAMGVKDYTTAPGYGSDFYALVGNNQSQWDDM